MFAWDIGYWYCCLNPREQGVLRGTIMGIAETLNVGIPKIVWDFFWLPYGGDSEAVRLAFLATYRLEIVTIPLGEPPIDETVVRALYPLDYASWFLFLLSPEAACIGGCQQSRVP